MDFSLLRRKHEWNEVRAVKVTVNTSDMREREKADLRRRRSWNLLAPLVVKYLQCKFNYKWDDFDPGEIDGPMLIAVNHACAYDPLLAGAAFRKKPLTFIASEHILRMNIWGPLLDRHFSIIPHQKGSKGSRTALMAMKRMKRGESIFLAVEGEQTWDGMPLPVMPYTGRLAKISGATLVTYRLEGGYLSAPRWSKCTRKGRIYGHVVNVYRPKMLKEMSDEDVETAIAEDLSLSIWEWQKSQADGPVRYKCRGKGAEGLERAVFTCPSCGSFGRLRSEGDHIGCSCGFNVRFDETGYFDPPKPFETIVEWEKHDRAALEKKLRECSEETCNGYECVAFSDDEVTLVKIGNKHTEEWTETGRLSLVFRDGRYELDVSGHTMLIDEISGMTMVLARRIVLSDRSGYYEIRAARGRNTNLRKYVIAKELIRSE